MFLYIGPGLGGGIIASIIGVILSLLLVIIALIWVPIKKLIRFIQNLNKFK
jgi:hypothetical protein